MGAVQALVKLVVSINKPGSIVLLDSNNQISRVSAPPARPGLLPTVVINRCQAMKIIIGVTVSGILLLFLFLACLCS